MKKIRHGFRALGMIECLAVWMYSAGSDQSKAVVPLLRKEMIISEKYCWYRLKAMKKS